MRDLNNAEGLASPQPVSGDAPDTLTDENLAALEAIAHDGWTKKWTGMELVDVHQGLVKLLKEVTRGRAGDAPKVHGCTCNPKPLNGQHWTGCPDAPKVEEREHIPPMTLRECTEAEESSPSTDSRQGYSKNWHRVILMVSIAGEVHSIGGDAVHGPAGAEAFYPGFEILKRKLSKQIPDTSQKVYSALKRLYEETADYIRINNLGDVHHNQAMKDARDALVLRPYFPPAGECFYCKFYGQEHCKRHFPPASQTPKFGIYVASKTKHAQKWKDLRAAGEPIISTWIDESGIGETKSFEDLWRRCIDEAASAERLVVYAEDGDELKGALVEVGAALASGTPVWIVGTVEALKTACNHRLMRKAASIKEAFSGVNTFRATPASTARTDGPNFATNETEQRQIDIINLRLYAKLAEENEWKDDVLHWSVFQQTLEAIATRLERLPLPAAPGSVTQAEPPK